MEQTSGLTTIQSIVDDYLNEIGSTSESDSLRFARIVERGMSHLSMFILDSISVQTVKVDKTLGIAPYPSDFRSLIRLGVKQPNGRLYTLTRDDELVYEDEGVCDVKLDEPYDLTKIGQLSGRRGGYSHYGTYKTDDKNRRVIFGRGVDLDEVVFEYTGSGVNKGGITYIPAIATEALIAYLKWKTSANLPQGLRMEYKIEWSEALQDLNRVTMPTMEEMMDALSQGTTQMATKG
jgi:hypothetical protein